MPCDVCSVKEAVGHEGWEVRSVKCVKYEVWSVKEAVGREK